MSSIRACTGGKIWMGMSIVLAGALIAAAIGFAVPWEDRGQTGPIGDGTNRVEVIGEHVAFYTEIPEGVAIFAAFSGESSYFSSDSDEPCEHVRYRLDGFGLVIEAISLTCDVRDDQSIQNGFHGAYRSLDDVPDPRDHVTVDTGLGLADVFTQTYMEYTNSSNEYEDLVAIFELTEPVDPDYPALVVRSEKSGMDRAAFVELVERFTQPRGLAR